MMGYIVVAMSLIALKLWMLVYLLAEYFENRHNYRCCSATGLFMGMYGN